MMPAEYDYRSENQMLAKPYHAATRTGLRKATVPLDPAMRALKRLAVEADKTVEELMREAIAGLLPTKSKN
jgi:hypothetical protein